MKIENQVVSLELSKKIKELGVKQDSLFSWWCDSYAFSEKSRWMILDSKTERQGIVNGISAFTVAELGELLPEGFNSSRYEENGWLCQASLGGKYFEEKTEADARAKMLIYLLENKIK